MWNGWTLDSVLRLILAAAALATAVLNYLLARRRK